MSSAMFDDDGNRIPSVSDDDRRPIGATVRDRPVNPWAITAGVITVVAFLIGLLLLVVGPQSADPSVTEPVPVSQTIAGIVLMVVAAVFGAAWVVSAGVRWSISHDRLDRADDGPTA